MKDDLSNVNSKEKQYIVKLLSDGNTKLEIAKNDHRTMKKKKLKTLAR